MTEADAALENYMKAATVCNAADAGGHAAAKARMIEAWRDLACIRNQRLWGDIGYPDCGEVLLRGQGG